MSNLTSNTLQTSDDLLADFGGVGNLIGALEREREISKELELTAEKQAARLDRIGEHLYTLSKFAKGFIDDPWPSATKRRNTNG